MRYLKMLRRHDVRKGKLGDVGTFVVQDEDVEVLKGGHVRKGGANDGSRVGSVVGNGIGDFRELWGSLAITVAALLAALRF